MGSKSASESKLLQAIQGTKQGLETSAAQKADILAAVEELVEAGAGTATASSSDHQCHLEATVDNREGARPSPLLLCEPHPRSWPVSSEITG